MTVERLQFRRLVVGFQQSTPAHSMRFAAEFAGLLHLDLFGMFVEDTRLFGLGALPFAREFRSLGGGWHPIDVARLSQELEIAGKLAERLFAGAVRELQTECRFEVVKGTTAEALAAVSRADIVMILEPGAAAERATEQFTALTTAAFRSVAAVMLVPRKPLRASGPIVAIAATPNDPSVQVARQVAAAINQEAVILDISARTTREGTPLADATAIARAFGLPQEGMIVVTRGSVDERAPALIASSRRVPVLVVEPDESATSLSSH